MNETAIVKFLATEVLNAIDWVEQSNEWEAWDNPPAIRPVMRFENGGALPFDPFNDIRHAFMVVDKMDGWMFELYLDGNWDCVLVNYPDAGKAEADTPAKAICIAAVRALATPEQQESWL